MPCNFCGFSPWLVATGTLSSLLWGIILCRPFKWLFPQPLGPLLVYSHTCTEQHSAEYFKGPSEDLQSSLSICVALFPLVLPAVNSSCLRFPGLPTPSSLDYTWCPFPCSAALTFSPCSELGNPGTRVICFHCSGTSVLSCLVFLNHRFFNIRFFPSCFRK